MNQTLLMGCMIQYIMSTPTIVNATSPRLFFHSDGSLTTGVVECNSASVYLELPLIVDYFLLDDLFTCLLSTTNDGTESDRSSIYFCSLLICMAISQLPNNNSQILLTS